MIQSLVFKIMIYTSSSLKAIIFNPDPGLSFSLLFFGWIFPMIWSWDKGELLPCFNINLCCMITVCWQNRRGAIMSIFSFYKEAWSFEISKMIAVVRRQIEYYFLSFLHLRLKFQIIVIDISTPVTNLLKR